MIATKAEFDWIAERGAADDFNASAVAETHLKQPTTKFRFASNC